MNNTDRAKSAERAMLSREPHPDESNLRDLLCDLRHLADRTGRNWDEELRMAMSYYRAEVIEDGSDADQEKLDSPTPLTQASQNLIDQLATLRVLVAEAAFVLEEEEREIEVQLDEVDTTVEAIHTIHVQEGI